MWSVPVLLHPKNKNHFVEDNTKIGGKGGETNAIKLSYTLEHE